MPCWLGRGLSTSGTPVKAQLVSKVVVLLAFLPGLPEVRGWEEQEVSSREEICGVSPCAVNKGSELHLPDPDFLPRSCVWFGVPPCLLLGGFHFGFERMEMSGVMPACRGAGNLPSVHPITRHLEKQCPCWAQGPAVPRMSGWGQEPHTVRGSSCRALLPWVSFWGARQHFPTSLAGQTPAIAISPAWRRRENPHPSPVRGGGGLILRQDQWRGRAATGL